MPTPRAEIRPFWLVAVLLAALLAAWLRLAPRQTDGTHGQRVLLDTALTLGETPLVLTPATPLSAAGPRITVCALVETPVDGASAGNPGSRSARPRVTFVRDDGQREIDSLQGPLTAGLSSWCAARHVAIDSSRLYLAVELSSSVPLRVRTVRFGPRPQPVLLARNTVAEYLLFFGIPLITAFYFAYVIRTGRLRRLGRDWLFAAAVAALAAYAIRDVVIDRSPLPMGSTGVHLWPWLPLAVTAAALAVALLSHRRVPAVVRMVVAAVVCHFVTSLGWWIS